jgi:hypothetical protein
MIDRKFTTDPDEIFACDRIHAFHDHTADAPNLAAAVKRDREPTRIFRAVGI